MTPPASQWGDCLPAVALARAQQLVGAVRDYDGPLVTSLLTGTSPADLRALAVALAALVPSDQSPSELLAWNDSIETPPVVNGPRQLLPHGTHAAFNRHRKNGTEPCPACWNGERDYQRGRARRRGGTDLRLVTGETIRVTS